jgi:hypothetical protein
VPSLGQREVLPEAHFVSYCNNGGSAGPPCTTATAVAVTLPTAGTGCGTASDFCQNFVTILQAGPGLVSITTATSTINGNSTTTNPFQMQNQVCRFNTPDNANWQAHCWDDNSAQPVNTDTGSANAYVSACPGVAPPLQIGDKCAFQAAHQSTGASTLNASSTGIVNITRMGGGALQSGDILASPSIAYVIYDGSEWALLDPQGAASGISATAANPLTASGASTAVSSPAWFSLSYAGYQDAGGDACKTLYNALTVLPPGAWIEDDLPAGRLKCTQNPFTQNLSSAQNPAVFTGIMYSTNPHAFYMSGSSTWILPLGFSWKGAGFSGLAGDGSRGTALIACNATSNGSVCPGAFSNDTPMIAWITSATSGASGVGAGKDTALWKYRKIKISCAA